MGQASPFQTEAWTEYGFGVVILLLRFFARFRTVGIKSWQGDDYFAIVALLFWTAELSMLELIGRHGTNIGWTPEQRAAFSDADIASLQIGSKCLLAGWICYTSLIWSLKACMIFFYLRITSGLWHQKIVKASAVLCVCTYLSVLFTILLHCRPLHGNWQVNPDPGDHCTYDLINYIVIAVTNVTTDAILVTIPIPLLVRVKISLSRKLVIGLLLCSGVFVMVATLLRCILSLKDVKSINTSTIWAIRETFVAIIAVNAPCIKPLFSGAKWMGSTKDKSSKIPTNVRNSGSYNLSKLRVSQNNTHKGALPTIDDKDSQEFILDGSDHDRSDTFGFTNNVSTSSNQARSPGIQVTTTYEVTNV
ncbi:hypothetical protein BGW36DRAFT_423898 [Talaromyces proteolyticus]|uniref:Rhodopsin domain-containing protein n=1 Tax=Talaromyces proteolyticus TaxID=1131652 RepID=A0AAD4L010_9EURO|nr:uncharacterized protein BGW36DRAFT_423898 [Talaromyces proteolyticus]KAH8701591.1 hypothetical protein BGW36DRAFT_423898 [Talaromyces proteolyticus]